MRPRCYLLLCFFFTFNLLAFTIYFFTSTHNYNHRVAKWTSFLPLSGGERRVGCTLSNKAPNLVDPVGNALVLLSVQALPLCLRLLLKWGNINLADVITSSSMNVSYNTLQHPILLRRLFDATGCTWEDLFPSRRSSLSTVAVEIGEHCFTPVFNQPELEVTRRTLLKICNVFHEKSVEYILDSGSVIGSWRHHGPIPYDDDIDFRIWREDKPRVKRILEALANDKSNGMVFQDTENENQHWKMGYSCPFTRDNTSLGDCHFQIDFFFNWICETDPSSMCFLEPPRKYPLSIVYPLIRRPFAGLLLPTYHDVESYMRATYTADMRMCLYYTHSVVPAHKKCSTPTVPCTALRHRFPFVERHPVAKFNLSTFMRLPTAAATISHTSTSSSSHSHSSSSSSSSTSSASSTLFGHLEFLCNSTHVLAIFFSPHL